MHVADAGWAFVDVETTGLNPSWDRVVSVSVLAFDPAGRLEGELHSLVDPQRDPGPVHIHGLTRERLAGAPLFEALAPRVGELTHGRVLVAHNAQFDYKFLHAETERAAVALPTTHRLCTVALSRRLDLPVENHKLATVAAYWGVRQHAAHDARDDVRVLREVFLHCQAFAHRLGVELPVVPCSGRGAIVYPASIPRVPSPFANPRTWTPPARLVQGMKVVITGTTVRPRQELAKDLTSRGLDVMNSVSGQTRLVLCNEPSHQSVKHEKAHAAGIPVLTESAVLALLDDVAPGVLRGEAVLPPAPRPAARSTPSKAAAPAGVWVGRTVLVIGGTAEQAALAREQVGALGARVLVNLGARTTHVLCLDGAERDERLGRVRDRDIPQLTLADLDPSGSRDAVLTDEGAAARSSVVMSRGHVLDLPACVVRYGLSVSWLARPALSGDAFEVDVVAFVLGADDLVQADDDFVFYNQPSTPDGGVRLTVDGSSEQGIDVDLEALGDDVGRVRVAAAIDGRATFGEVGAIRLSLTDADTGAEIASATLDAATDERSLVLAELYPRNDTWRFRAVGQGYEHALEQLVVDHGVVVD